MNGLVVTCMIVIPAAMITMRPEIRDIGPTRLREKKLNTRSS